MEIKSEINASNFSEEEKAIREADKNFLNSDWWKTATPEDIEAEIAKGADVNAVIDETAWIIQNPLTFALNSALYVPSKIIEISYDIDRVQSSENAMDYIAKYNYEKTPEAVEKFREKRKNDLKELKNRKNITENNIRTLIKYGADVNSIDKTYLSTLAFDAQLDLLNILIEEGLDVNVQLYENNKKSRMINNAANFGQKKFVKRLLEAGAEDTRTLWQKIKTHLGFI